jgi:hypothetical protein
LKTFFQQKLPQARNGVVEIWNPFSAILVECFLKTSTMNEISFQHCQRDANQVAHELVKFTFESNLCNSWDGDSPNFILPFVIHDVTPFSLQ